MLFALFLMFLTFIQGDELMVKVNKLTSTKTQLPYSYYSLPFCKPDKIVDSAENLGEVLRGDRIENSAYVVSFFNYYLIKILHQVLAFPLGVLYRSYNACLAFGILVLNIFFMQFKMRQPQMCTVVCRVVLNAKTAKEFQEKIEDEYRVNM